MTEHPLACDTTVLLYLGRIGQVNLLPALFSPIIIPETVALELDMGRLLRPDTVNHRDLAWAVSAAVGQEAIAALPPNRLGMGERAVLAYARTHPGCVAGLDDLPARRLAESLGIVVAGTPGILLRAKRAGLIAAVRPLIDALIAQGFRLDPDLYQEIVELAHEA